MATMETESILDDPNVLWEVVKVMLICFDSTKITIICQLKGDMLVREEMPNHAHGCDWDAESDMHWPAGVVEYKFYRTFPP